MAMGFFNLSPNQLGAAKQIYQGFNAYALQNGASPQEAQQFAQMGLGVASGEGLMKADPWSSNPDNGGTSVGPFQLLLGKGLGANLNGNYSPQNQIQVAASNMWNGAGDEGYYNTQPWNAVGNTPGSGGNDTYAGQTMAQNIGAQYTNAYPSITGGSSGPVGDASQPTTNSNLPTSGYTSTVASGNDPNNPNPIGANSSLPLMASGQPNTNYTDPTAAPNAPDPGNTPPSPGTGMPVQDQGLTGTVAAMASAIAKAITGVGNAQDKTAQNDTIAQDKTAQASTYSLVGALSGIGNAAFANVFDIFGRSALLATGLILMIGAILFTMKSGGQKLVPTL